MSEKRRYVTQPVYTDYPLVSLPMRLGAANFARAHVVVRTVAAVFSLGLGLMMAYQIGVGGGLLL